MRTITSTLVALAVISTASADLKSDINTMNTAVTKAFMKKDFVAVEKAMKAGLAPGFKYVEAGKTQTFDEMFQGVKGGLGALSKITNAKAVTSNLKIKGNSATGTTTHTIEAIMVMDKKPHKMVMVGTSKDEFKKFGKDWKMTVMTWGSQTMTLDGKPMGPAMSGSRPPKK